MGDFIVPLKEETIIHTCISEVLALQNFAEVLVACVTCNIQKCKNGYYKGRNKEFSEIFVLKV